MDATTLSPGPISASYVVPGSSGTLKETHIFTPNKGPIINGTNTKDTRTQSNIVNEFDKPAAGVVIDESVVKKEYRDVVYDPEKLKVSNKIDADDFTEFQSVEVSQSVPDVSSSIAVSTTILEPTKALGSIVINWPDPGDIVNITNLDDFNYATISNTEQSLPPISSTETTSDIILDDISKPINDSNEFPAIKDYSKPEIGVSPSEYMFTTSIQSTSVCNIADNEFDDEFTDFQSIDPVVAPTKTIPNFTTNVETQHATTSKFIYPLPIVASNSKALDTNHTSIWQQLNNNNTPMATAIQASQPIIQAAYVPSVPLVPFQASECLVPEVKSTNTISSEPRIEWPNSGIDPDEMARLEALFPQPKTISQNMQSTNKLTKPQSATNRAATSNATQQSNADVDDEWSDFVSVTQPQLPITNILSQSLQKQQNDDDDWSDFVSSNGPVQHQPWTNSSGPSFSSWNAPQQGNYGGPSIFQSSTHQRAIPPPPSINTIDFPSIQNPSHQNGYTNSFNNVNIKTKSNGKLPLRPMQNKTSASIISLPDLGFVGSKSLSNTPKTNITKK